MTELSGLEVAVVGMAGRFPGAETVDAYRELISAGRSALSIATDAELDAAGVAPTVYRRPDYVRTRGRLTDAEYFDSKFFGYAPRDAELLDPQQRIFLECAWHALEDAGYAGPRSPEQLVGVYASTNLSWYLLRNLLPNPQAAADLDMLRLRLSNEKDLLASRVSYAMDLRGPAVVVQSACSSSLLAVHQAAQSLIGHECDLALAGGVSLQLPQTEGFVFQQGDIMSPDGRCRPYDAVAGGTAAGNGVGVVVLKRLRDALDDGDTIHATILGSATGNDGNSRMGFTAPGVDGQAAVIRAALDVSGVSPDSVGYIEGHGTATVLGDAVEVAALSQAYGPASHTGPWCALGSVKALIGHLDVAAGIAGFIKAVICVRDGFLPPSPYFVRGNPDAELARSPFHVNTSRLPWPADFQTRRAGVSAFGMGGTGVHVVIEEPPRPRQRTVHAGPHVLVLSAHSPQALEAGRKRLTDHLRANPDLDPADVAYTLLRGRRRHNHRMSLVCNDIPEAIRELDRPWRASGPVHRDIVYLFPGQGSQRAAMGADMYSGERIFRECVDECAALLTEKHDIDIVGLLTGPGDDTLLNRTEYAQPALFVMEYATALLWQHLGVRPRAMIGHSIGEYVAAALCGVMEPSDALNLVCERGRLMDTLPPGAMLSVEAAAADLPRDLPHGVEVAAYNAPDFCVLAGPGDRIAVVEQRLAEHGIGCRRLHTSHAFHSSAVEPLERDYARAVASVRLSAPRIPFVSTVTGTWITDDLATDPGYWVRQMRQPVRFEDGVRTLLERPRQVLLEVGPGMTLTSLISRFSPDGFGHVAVSTAAHSGEITHRSLARAWARLWAEGVDLDETGRGDARRISLPPYAFDRTRHWVEQPGTQSGVAKAWPKVVVPPPSRQPQPDGDESAGLQALITAAWRHQLGIESIGPHDDFFSLGGHSLVAARIVAELQTEVGGALSTEMLFEYPTVAGLAARIERTRSTS